MYEALMFMVGVFATAVGMTIGIELEKNRFRKALRKELERESD